MLLNSKAHANGASQQPKTPPSWRKLLETLNRKLVLDWRKRQQSRAAVRLAIEDILYERLPECYSEELCEQKRDDVYQHVYANYWGAGQSVYAVA
jgi:type I restriction enzyme R subunit